MERKQTHQHNRFTYGSMKKPRTELGVESMRIGKVLVASVVSDSLWPPWTVALQAPLSMGFSMRKFLPEKNTGMGCHSPLQGTFPMWGSNPGLLHCRQILYCLSHKREVKSGKHQPWWVQLPRPQIQPSRGLTVLGCLMWETWASWESDLFGAPRTQSLLLTFLLWQHV